MSILAPNLRQNGTADLTGDKNLPSTRGLLLQACQLTRSPRQKTVEKARSEITIRRAHDTAETVHGWRPGQPSKLTGRISAARCNQALNLRTQTWRSSLHPLGADNLLLSNGREHGDENGIAILLHLQDVLDHLPVFIGWLACLHEGGQVQVVLRLAKLQEQANFASLIVSRKKLVLRALRERDLHVVRRGAQVLVLLSREDVQRHDVGLRVPVLARLRRGNLGHLAGFALDHHHRALAKLSTLLRVCVRGSRLGRLERGLVVVRHGSLALKVQASF
mmetsp:Transcript_11241/g.31349  ORF Transcript_11241/g.31349 Transcript_11241/m.31349 type:complete len:277 (-) Transcript_11241:39-869(-)